MIFTGNADNTTMQHGGPSHAILHGTNETQQHKMLSYSIDFQCEGSTTPYELKSPWQYCLDNK